MGFFCGKIECNFPVGIEDDMKMNKGKLIYRPLIMIYSVKQTMDVTRSLRTNRRSVALKNPLYLVDNVDGNNKQI